MGWFLRYPLRPLAGATFSVWCKVVGLLVVVVILSSAVRVMPWVVDPRVGWATIWVFVRGIWLASVSTLFVISTIFSWTWSAMLAHDRQEARACFLVGARPSGLVLSTGPIAVLISGLLFSAVWWGQQARNQESAALTTMIQAARRDCDPDRQPVASIPGMNLAWLCDGNQTRLVASPRPGMLVQAGHLHVAEHSQSAWLEHARVDTTEPVVMTVRVARLEVVGWALNGRGDSPHFYVKTISLALATWCCAWGLQALFLKDQEARRLIGMIWSVIGVASVMLSAAWLDQWTTSVWLQSGGVILAGMLPVFGYVGISRNGGRIKSTLLRAG
jgi:hypothetical protein